MITALEQKSRQTCRDIIAFAGGRLFALSVLK